MSDEISIAFLGALVPDESNYHNPAFRRSGNMVQDGIVNGFTKNNVKVTVFSLRPVPSFPAENKIFFHKEKIKYRHTVNFVLVPFLNILLLKTVSAMVAEFFELLIWALKNRKNKRCIVVYNAYTPPLPFVYWMGKLTGSKSVAILYDLGMPPKQLQLSKLKKIIYRLVEFFAKRYIPKIDGRIVINENIARDYAPGKDFLLVDGGISDDIIKRLFELNEKNDRELTKFLIAGSVSPINGTRLVSEALALTTNKNIRIIFAGNGRDSDFLINLEKEDDRVEYRGMLNLDQLFELYKEVDVLLNLRVTSAEDLYLFPSKVLEYLTIGKFVLSTSVGHLESEYGQFCMIIKEITPKLLASKITEISEMTNNELIAKGKKSRQYMLETHTWDQQAVKIFDYINSIN